MSTRAWPARDLEFVPNCPVCGSTDRSLLYKGLTDRVFCAADGTWDLYRCAHCASGWLDPRPSAGSIGGAYENYYTHVSEDDLSVQPKSALVRQLHAWQNDYKNARYGLRRKPASFGGRWLVPLVPPLRAKADAQCRHMIRPPVGGGHLLDVGSGSGAFLEVAREMGWNAEGIDFDPKAVELAKGRGLNVSCVSAANLNKQENKYDVITLSHVIEHVYDPVTLLSDLYRLLKPGGVLWLETPNIESSGSRRFSASWRGLEIPRHLLLFNARSLRQVISEAGFNRINQHWHAMILFSIYTESSAIANGDSAMGATPQVFPSSLAVIDELHGMLHPARREFLTFTAHK